MNASVKTLPLQLNCKLRPSVILKNRLSIKIVYALLFDTFAEFRLFWRAY